MITTLIYFAVVGVLLVPLKSFSNELPSLEFLEFLDADDIDAELLDEEDMDISDNDEQQIQDAKQASSEQE
ncbi:MAG: hypothetical protein JKX92_15830 [Porticoccaceae bacterium]|nr:hypothetical protein [Porticoccaceae bacterium]